MVVPDADNGDEHIASAHHQIENEKQEVPLVSQSDAVVNPGKVVIHGEHAGVTHRAVMRPSWFS